MIPEILDIQEQIGADQELRESLGAITRLVCPHRDLRYGFYEGSCDETGYQDRGHIATCTTCGEAFYDEEIEQELARQAGGAA